MKDAAQQKALSLASDGPGHRCTSQKGHRRRRQRFRSGREGRPSSRPTGGSWPGHAFQEAAEPRPQGSHPPPFTSRANFSLPGVRAQLTLRQRDVCKQAQALAAQDRGEKPQERPPSRRPTRHPARPGAEPRAEERDPGRPTAGRPAEKP